MKRRNFLQQGTLAGLSALALGGISQSASAAANEPKKAGQPFNLNYAPHDGMFKNNGGADFLDQIRYAYDQGFRSIEDNGMLGRDTATQEKIGSLLAQKGMTMGVFVVDTGNNWKTSLTTGKQEFTDAFLKTCKQSVEVAKRVNAKWATVVPGYFERTLPMGIQTANVVEALRRGAEIFEPHGLVMVLEPLSDNPDLFLRTAEQSFEVCKAVKSPSCKILYDIYHMQRNVGNLIPVMDMCWDEIAYIQIGDNPGRKEPGTGEINYKNIFKHLHQKGYKGVLGMEHGISGKGADGELALIKAYRDADNFL
ncbi:hydroxypyruvate isomerase family protein [Chitinophaga sp. Cy-1792]|uniref:hydroxypyruvate isomerase family protein n=1 Tax=Chitinophaga sp. Cy-1792 TaxID=2608339 RepID=UPI00141D871D|nr:TIM barrel protein [Chitinophaga sp. Cy-1792]NIG52358.1 TIM barrel protein [Chitinophaga sp. Cy-1792]